VQHYFSLRARFPAGCSGSVDTKRARGRYKKMGLSFWTVILFARRVNSSVRTYGGWQFDQE